jgi:hypothetical protein
MVKKLDILLWFRKDQINMNKELYGKAALDIWDRDVKDCPYSKYWQMTDKHECTLRSGMFCRCTLETYGKCILAEKESEEK